MRIRQLLGLAAFVAASALMPPGAGAQIIVPGRPPIPTYDPYSDIYGLYDAAMVVGPLGRVAFMPGAPYNYFGAPYMNVYSPYDLYNGFVNYFPGGVYGGFAGLPTLVPGAGSRLPVMNFGLPQAGAGGYPDETVLPEAPAAPAPGIGNAPDVAALRQMALLSAISRKSSRVTVRRALDGKITLNWHGDLRGVARIDFALQDDRGRILTHETRVRAANWPQTLRVDTLAVGATLARPAGARYYRVFVSYLDGRNETVMAPLKS